MKKITILLLTALLVLLLSGCGKNATSDEVGSKTAGSEKTITIGITDLTFSPTTLTIKKGDTVTWVNNHQYPHTISSDTGSELRSPTLGQGNSFSHTFTTAGTFDYHCNLHTTMKARVVVEE